MRLPFGDGRHAPITAEDQGRVIAVDYQKRGHLLRLVLWMNALRDPGPRLAVLRLESFHARVDIGEHWADGRVGL
jgi:hypothetical protein